VAKVPIKTFGKTVVKKDAETGIFFLKILQDDKAKAEENIKHKTEVTEQNVEVTEQTAEVTETKPVIKKDAETGIFFPKILQDDKAKTEENIEHKTEVTEQNVEVTEQTAEVTETKPVVKKDAETGIFFPKILQDDKAKAEENIKHKTEVIEQNVEVTEQTAEVTETKQEEGEKAGGDSNRS